MTLAKGHISKTKSQVSDIRTMDLPVYLQVTLADLHVLARLIPTLEAVFKSYINKSKRWEKIITTKKPATETLDYDILQNMFHVGSSSELDVSSDEIESAAAEGSNDKKIKSENTEYSALEIQDMINTWSEKQKPGVRDSKKIKEAYTWLIQQTLKNKKKKRRKKKSEV